MSRDSRDPFRKTASKPARLLLTLVAASLLAGCGGYGARKERTVTELMEHRKMTDARLAENSRKLIEKVLARVEARYAEFESGRRAEQPVLEVLIISGGGDWGAFGAGFLKGWGRVPPGSMARPQFDIVTGVSTGALIAPFAFIGTDEYIERVVQLYRNPKPDWVKERWPLYFLPNNISFAEVPGLEREMHDQLDSKMVALLAKVSKRGEGGRAGGHLETARDDGGPLRRSGQGPELVVEDHPKACLERTSLRVPHGPLGRERLLLSHAPTIEDVSRDPTVHVELAIDLAEGESARDSRRGEEDAVMDVRGVDDEGASLLPHAMAEISRLRRGADIEVRSVSVPGDWAPPEPGVFIKRTMNELCDLGEKMGADPANWSTESPP